MILPFAHQGFIVKSPDQPKSGRPRDRGNILPLLVALEDFLGSGCQLLVDPTVLLNVPHVILWLYYIRHVNKGVVPPNGARVSAQRAPRWEGARLAPRLPALEYPDRFEVRYVSANGGIRWNTGWMNVSIVCAGEYVGLEEIDDGIWNVYFGPLKLGRLLKRHMRIEDAYGRLKRHNV